MTIHTISHKHAKMYAICGTDGCVLYDCLWQDSIDIIRPALGKIGISQIRGFFVSHFHPDHAEAFGGLLSLGLRPLVFAWQMPHIAWLNDFFTKPKNDPARRFVQINTAALCPITTHEAADILHACGLAGVAIQTPGHSPCGMSLVVQGAAFVGDMPRFEVAEAFGAEAVRSWGAILAADAVEIYYAHGSEMPNG